MSELFSKNFKKHSTRAKEKLLEKVGKADRTTDEEFEDHANNFAKQQKGAEKLNKELRNYVGCIKAMSQASRAFHEAVREAYEPEWPGIDHVKAMSQSIELLWEDFHEKMQGQALSPLSAYTSQFMEIKNKMGKRGRKLVDFDSARHNHEAIAGAKGTNEVKSQKAQEQMLLAKKLYEDLNGELLEELPALYDSRITFYVNNMQTIFNLEQTFHAETAKLSKDLCVQMDELGQSLGKLRVPRKSIDDTPAPKPHPPKPVPPSPKSPTTPSKIQQSPPTSPTSNSTPVRPQENGKPANGTEASGKAEPANPFDSASESGSAPNSRRGSEEVKTGKTEIVETKTIEEIDEAKEEEEETAAAAEEEDETQPLLRSAQPEKPAKKPTEEAAAAPEGPPPENASENENESTKTESLESKVLYKVRATHRYTAEDGDELSFEPGEVISVIPFEDPEEQDEGWLNGTKDTDGSTGVFPANFTRPL